MAKKPTGIETKRNTKNQAPNIKEAPNTKFQTPEKLQAPSSKLEARAAVWCLELGISLVFGVWCFNGWIDLPNPPRPGPGRGVPLIGYGWALVERQAKETPESKH
jgi:hypothetical protein